MPFYHVRRLRLVECPSTEVILSTTPAIVYFPPGTYLVSSPLNAYYYTQLIGDARTPPTLLASAGFAGMAVIGTHPRPLTSSGSAAHCLSRC